MVRREVEPMAVNRIRELMLAPSVHEPQLTQVFDRLCSLVAGLDVITQEDLRGLDEGTLPHDAISERQTVIREYRPVLGRMIVWTLSRFKEAGTQNLLAGAGLSLQRFYDVSGGIGGDNSVQDGQLALEHVQSVQARNYARVYLHLEV